MQSAGTDGRGAEKRSDERMRREQGARTLTNAADEQLLIGQRVAAGVVGDLFERRHRRLTLTGNPRTVGCGMCRFSAGAANVAPAAVALGQARRGIGGG